MRNLLRQINNFIRNNNVLLRLILLYIVPFSVSVYICIYKLQLIYVSCSYIDIVYAAQVSVSVIIITILALITSSLSETYLGFSLREILMFRSNPIHPKRFIYLSLFNIALNTIWYILKWIDGVTITLFISIILSLWFSKIIISVLIRSDDFLNQNIMNEILYNNNDRDILRYARNIETFLEEASTNEIASGDEVIAWDMFRFIYERFNRNEGET